MRRLMTSSYWEQLQATGPKPCFIELRRRRERDERVPANAERENSRRQLHGGDWPHAGVNMEVCAVRSPPVRQYPDVSVTVELCDCAPGVMIPWPAGDRFDIPFDDNAEDVPEV